MHAAACSGGLMGLRALIYSLVFPPSWFFFAAPRIYRFRTGGCFLIFLAATAVREVCVCEGGVGGEGWAGGAAGHRLYGGLSPRRLSQYGCPLVVGSTRAGPWTDVSKN